jgi:hypothetical protein
MLASAMLSTRHDQYIAVLGALMAFLVIEDPGIQYERRWHVLNAVAYGTSYPSWASEAIALNDGCGAHW